VLGLINHEQLLTQMSPSKSLPFRSVDAISQQDNNRKISNISTASTDSAYTSDTNTTYKQFSDINQVPNMVKAMPENFISDGNDNIYHQDPTTYQNVEPTINQDPTMYQNIEPQINQDPIMYQNIEPQINQDPTMYQNFEPAINQDQSSFIPNTTTQWNYQMNPVQNQPQTSGADEESQRKISTVSTLSNLSSLSSDSVQGLVQQDIQHHAIIHEENATQNMHVQNQEGINNTNTNENENYCSAQSPTSETCLSNVQTHQENQVCTNSNQVKSSEEISVVEEKPMDIAEPLTNSTEPETMQNLR